MPNRVQLCNPMDSCIHGIFQARVLEWVAISFSREFSWPRDRTWVSCIAGRRFTIWATRKASILYTKHLSDIWFINIFSHSEGCIFNFLIVHFEKILFEKCNLSMFFLWLLVLMAFYIRNSDLIQGRRYLYFSKCFALLAITFRSQFILNWLLYMVWNWNLASFISCGYSCPRIIH